MTEKETVQELLRICEEKIKESGTAQGHYHTVKSNLENYLRTLK